MYQNTLSRFGGVIILPASDIQSLNTEKPRGDARRAVAAHPWAPDEVADQHDGDLEDEEPDDEEPDDEEPDDEEPDDEEPDDEEPDDEEPDDEEPDDDASDTFDDDDP